MRQYGNPCRGVLERARPARDDLRRVVRCGGRRWSVETRTRKKEAVKKPGGASGGRLPGEYARWVFHALGDMAVPARLLFVLQLAAGAARSLFKRIQCCRLYVRQAHRSSVPTFRRPRT